MTWELHETSKTEVTWRRDDGVLVSFAREGYGEPVSGTDRPPDSIDKYAAAREKPAPDETSLEAHGFGMSMAVGGVSTEN